MLFAVIFSLLNAPFSHADLTKDIQAIQGMQGCFSVGFNFVETGTVDPLYPVRSADYHEYGTEWVSVDLVTDREVHLQHVLVVPGSNSAQPLMAQKHWRQEWEFQPTFKFNFKGNLTWLTDLLTLDDTKGQWVQRVFQVDDSPRYECVAAWKHYENGSMWSCETYAPLPRREFTQRADYQILNRGNIHTINAAGWDHVQNNEKLKLNADGSVSKIASEIGFDTYKKIDAQKCAAAKTYWESESDVWHVIQSMWRHIRSHHPDLHFKARVNNQLLWQRLFALSDKYANQTVIDESALSREAHDTIHEFMLGHD